MSVRNPVRSATRSPQKTVLEPSGGLAIPGRADLRFLCLDGESDIIGLSVADFDDVTVGLQPIFFDAGPTLRDVADIATLAYANGTDGCLIVNESISLIILYADGTDETILARARRYAGVI